MKKLILAAASAAFLATSLSAQSPVPDTMQDIRLKDLEIRTTRAPFQTVEKLPDVHGCLITAGKSSEVIPMDGTPASLSEKTVRQVLAKIPGAFAYDMDGSGNQVNFALRGLDPHRSWDMNVRQNGVILNSDLYGYPASHYNPPLESIDRIELIRGTASLQYGAMFGGMFNYVTKQADTSRLISFENQSSGGSFGQWSTYNSLGGRYRRLTWQVYDYRRRSDGYRDNSDASNEAQFGRLEWQLSSRLRLKAEVARSTYRFHIPGPLNDSTFEASPRVSTRNRNYYSPDILVPSLTLDWKIGPRTDFQWITSHLSGDRSSVQFLGTSDKVDAINPATGQYAARQVDIDRFNSATTEARITHRYRLGNMQSVLAGGTRLILNDLNRRQIGKGTTGSDYDLTLTDPNWGRDLHYKTQNAAFFVENLLYLTPQLSVSPGMRVESGITRMSGVIRALPPDRALTDIEHRFALFGVSAQYSPNEQWRIYGGIAQAYRPVVLGEVIPANILERVDPDLKDSRGYNAELGFQADLLGQRLKIHSTLFRVQYNDRIGNQALEDSTGSTYFLKTNIGDSRTDGVEFYAEFTAIRSQHIYLSMFTASAWMDARYTSGNLASGEQNIALEGKRVESVPRWTSRNGIQFSWKRLNASVQYSFVDETFSDPFNTITPTPNGARGIVPAYALWDAHIGFTFSKHLRLRISGNNLADRQYFTKRPTIYPGPGVWPSDGRSIVASAVINI